jgi:hypothetical protein
MVRVYQFCPDCRNCRRNRVPFIAPCRGSPAGVPTTPHGRPLSQLRLHSRPYVSIAMSGMRLECTISSGIGFAIIARDGACATGVRHSDDLRCCYSVPDRVIDAARNLSVCMCQDCFPGLVLCPALPRTRSLALGSESRHKPADIPLVQDDVALLFGSACCTRV